MPASGSWRLRTTTTRSRPGPRRPLASSGSRALPKRSAPSTTSTPRSIPLQRARRLAWAAAPAPRRRLTRPHLLRRPEARGGLTCYQVRRSQPMIPTRTHARDKGGRVGWRSTSPAAECHVFAPQGGVARPAFSAMLGLRPISDTTASFLTILHGSRHSCCGWSLMWPASVE